MRAERMRSGGRCLGGGVAAGVRTKAGRYLGSPAGAESSREQEAREERRVTS